MAIKTNTVINEAYIREKWVPVCKEAGINESSDLMNWLPTYAHYHAINENAYATPGNVPGMGAIRLPGNPNGQFGFSSQTAGSGDKPVSYLALSMQIAADTVGFNCVPVVPSDSPLTILTYADFTYAGGSTDSTTARPDVFKLDATLPAVVPGAILTLLDTANASAPLATLVYLGKSRLQGYPIFFVKTIVDGASVNDCLGAATASGDRQITDGTTTGAATINSTTALLVKALEDHIAGYSGQLFQRLKAAGSASASVDAMKYATMPYSRGDGETTSTRSMGMKFYNKSVEAETWQVDIAATREQIDDAKQFGFDVAEKARKVLVNETAQSLNKNILDRIFALGARNHKQIFDTTGQHFNVNFDYASGLGQTTFVLGWDNAGNLTTITTPSATPIAKVGTGGETLMTAQRRIVDQILAAANEIGIRGRREPADTIVTNSQVGTVLQSVQGFQASPFENNIRKVAGLRMLGTMFGLALYVDPNMSFDDTRVAVFRKGDGETPGLVYMPYKIADIVQITAEATMAPKFQLKSRGKLVEVGQNPELYYLVLRINTQHGLLR